MEEYSRYLPEGEAKQKFVFTDISDVAESAAQDAALARFNEKPESEIPKGWKKWVSGKFWKGVGRSIWKQNLARDFLEVKYKKEEEKKIAQTGSIFAAEKSFDENEKGISDAEKQRRREARLKADERAYGAITKRFGAATGELVGDLVHSEIGEKIDTLGDGGAERRIKREMQGVVKAYAAGNIDEARVLEEERRIFAALKGVKPEVLDKGKVYCSNLLQVARWAKSEVARQVKQNIEHNQAVINLQLDFDVVVGKAKNGAKTEAQFNSVERVVDKIQKKTRGIFGFVFNEAAITAVVSAAYYVKKSLFTRGASSALGFAGMVGATGITAAVREGRMLEKERMQHSREMAQGRKFDEGTAKRRNELEQFRVQFKTAKELEDNLKDSLFGWLESGHEIKDLSPEGYQHALAAVAEIDSRILEGERGIVTRNKPWKFWKKREERHKADLIGYSDPTRIAEEEGRLDAARAAGKILLKKWALAHGRTEEQFKADLQTAREGKIASFYEGAQGLTQLNERFKQFKRQKMWGSAKRAMKWGAIFGVAMQEASAPFQEHTYGVGEQISDWAHGQHHVFAPGEHATALESGIQHAGKGWDYLFPTVHAAGPPTELQFNASKYKLHEGLRLEDNPATPDPNDRILVDTAGNRHPLQFNTDGTPTAGTKQWFRDHGYTVNESATGGGARGIHNLDISETHNQFPDLAKHARVDWHDKPGDYWSEIHKQWLKFEGKQQMGYLVAEGDKVYLDCSKVIDNFLKEIQERVNSPDFGQVEGYLNADGTPFVDPGMMHLKQQIIEAIKNGDIHNHFQAAVIPTEGANSAGLSDLMQGADARGMIELSGKYDWSKMFIDPATGHVDPRMLHDGHLPFRFLEMRFDGHIMNTAQGASEIASMPVVEIIPPPAGELPPVVFPPVAYVGRRRGLEKPSEFVYYMHGYGGSEADIRAKEEIYKKYRSNTLEQNPNAKLDHFAEIENYFKRQDKRYLDSLKAMTASFEPMKKECRLAICIPVAGHQEGKQIYESLLSYANQKADKNTFEVVLYVNHPEVDRFGKPVKPDNTLEEIDRFKRDHPDLNIRVMYQALPIEKARIAYIRKVLNDAVLLRQHQRGKTASDLIMVSNDADNKGISPDYINNFVSKFDSHPNVDGYLGQLDWDPEAYTKHPAVHIGTRLFQYLGMYGRREGSGAMPSSGANFAFRSSIYAGVGGYIPGLEGGEDINFGQSIIAARKDFDQAKEDKHIQFAGARSSRLYTSARRAIYAWKKYGLPPEQQWNKEVGFSAFDDEVRRLENDGEDIDYDNPILAAKLKSDLESVVNLTLDSFLGDFASKDHEIIRKTLGRLGIKHKVNSRGYVEITDMSKVVRNLKEYQAYALLQRKAKSGDVGALSKFKEVRKRQRAEHEERKRATTERSPDIATETMKDNLRDLQARAGISFDIDNYLIDNDGGMQKLGEVLTELADLTGLEKSNLYSVKFANHNASKEKKIANIYYPLENLVFLKENPSELTAFKEAVKKAKGAGFKVSSVMGDEGSVQVQILKKEYMRGKFREFRSLAVNWRRPPQEVLRDLKAVDFSRVPVREERI